MNSEKCGALITGIGAYLPNQIVTSQELMEEVKAEQLGCNSRLFERATGIFERRFTTEDETYSLLAIESSQSAILDSGLDPIDIDYLIYCGIDKEMAEPSLAHEIANSIGAHRAVCFDINNACLGLMNGLSIANAYIMSGSAENVLICSAEKSSQITKDVIRQINTSGKKQELLRLMGAFTIGDSGGAFVVSRSYDDKGAKVMNFSSESSLSHLCYYRREGTKIEFAMDMENISSLMTEHHSRYLGKTYSMLNWKPDQIAKVYCHQVGAKPHKLMAKLANVDIEKAPVVYDRFANITSATFAVNMFLNRPKQGEKVLLLGAGSGCSACQIGMQF